MKTKWLLFPLSLIIFFGCDDDETNQVCSCSSTHDAYYYSDSVLTEGIAIANAFTPNGDALNDYFYIFGNGISTISIEVKDGSTIVFQSTSLTTKWNGAVNGNIPDCQNFDYVVDAVFTSGTTKHFEGMVTVYGNLTTPCPDSLQNCFFEYQFNGANFDPGIPNGELFSC